MKNQFFFERAGLWWPTSDGKHEKCFDFITRNTADLDKGIAHVKKLGCAVQAGGHVGIFPNYLASKGFKKVFTFEPEEDLFECLKRNVHEGVTPVRAALSATNGYVHIASKGARTCVVPSGGTRVFSVALDYSDLRVNYIHLDIERHEIEALRGAQQTIARDAPVIQLEILPDMKDAIYEFMASIGYVLTVENCRDQVFTKGCEP